MKTQKTSTANTHIHADGITHTHVDGITHAHADGSTHTHADDTVHTHASGSVHTHAHGSTHTHPHHHENTKAVLNRMNRAIGHMEAVRTMIEDDRDCSEVLFYSYFIEIQEILNLFYSSSRLIFDAISAIFS